MSKRAPLASVEMFSMQTVLQQVVCCKTVSLPDIGKTPFILHTAPAESSEPAQ